MVSIIIKGKGGKHCAGAFPPHHHHLTTLHLPRAVRLTLTTLRSTWLTLIRSAQRTWWRRARS